MSIRTTVIGSYPKVTEKGTDNLPRVIDRWQRKLVSDADLEEEVQKVIRRVLAEQADVEIDLITDGQIRWEDMPHAVARDARGIRRGSLRRLFDNNVYYRRLEVGDPVEWKESQALSEFRFASQTAGRPVKVALPGPVTLVSSTELKERQTPEKMLELYSDLLRREVEALAEAEVPAIQLDEPAWSPSEPLLKQGKEAVGRIFEGVKAQRWLALYFQDVSVLVPELLDLKEVDVLSLDLVSGRERNPELLERVREAIQKGNWSGELALGLLDARNTRLESLDEVRREIEAFSGVIPAERLWLCPNTGLEFLPHEATLRKLEVLKAAAHGS